MAQQNIVITQLATMMATSETVVTEKNYEGKLSHSYSKIDNSDDTKGNKVWHNNGTTRGINGKSGHREAQ